MKGGTIISKDPSSPIIIDGAEMDCIETSSPTVFRKGRVGTLKFNPNESGSTASVNGFRLSHGTASAVVLNKLIVLVGAGCSDFSVKVHVVNNGLPGVSD
ncbi:MAG: hypothetical protein AAFY08_08670, partial [Planctomycetota bacterium]